MPADLSFCLLYSFPHFPIGVERTLCAHQLFPGTVQDPEQAYPFTILPFRKDERLSPLSESLNPPGI